MISFSIFAVYEGKWAARETNKLFHLREMESQHGNKLHRLLESEALSGSPPHTHVRAVSSCRTSECYRVDCHCRRSAHTEGLYSLK